MLFFIAEGTRHATAAGRDRRHGIILRQGQQLYGTRHGGQRFLLAMPVELDRSCFFGELVGADPASVDLAGDEVVYEENVGGQAAGRRQQFLVGQVGVFVPEGEDGGGLDPDQRCFGGDEGAEEPDVPVGYFFRLPQQAFGQPCPATLFMLRDQHFVSQFFQQQDGALSYFGVVVIGELVAKKIYFFRGRRDRRGRPGAGGSGG